MGATCGDREGISDTRRNVIADMCRVRTARSGSLALLLAPCVWGLILAGTEPARCGVDMGARGADLLKRLNQGEEISLVAFGDSLTAGWGTDGVHAFPRLVAEALAYRFPRSHIRLTVHGHPGETTADALGRAKEEVIVARPDLVLVQFGGNDMGTGRPLDAYRRDLAHLLNMVSSETEAVVIACLAPISHEDPANAWSEAARAAAASTPVAIADLDRAIREGDADFRGPFPYGSHPGNFIHVIMAREILRAFDRVTSSIPSLTCRLMANPVLSAAPDYEFKAKIASLTGKPLECIAKIAYLDKTTERNLTAPPYAGVFLRQRLALPAWAPARRSYALLIHLWVRGGGYGDFDVRWLTVAPAVGATCVPAGEETAPRLNWQPLDGGSLVLGRHLWQGPRDLSGRFAVLAFPDRLRFLVQVTDDEVAPGTLDWPSEGDCIEVYLDLRNDDDQGKPVYTPDVIVLQILAPAGPDRLGQWKSMQPLPEDLRGIGVNCYLVPGGYEALVDVPLAPIQARRGQRWQGLGFDIGIDDADSGGGRKTQMMWAGIADNYLNPAFFAGLYLDPIPEGATRRILR